MAANAAISFAFETCAGMRRTLTCSAMRLEFDILPLQTRHEFHIARAAAPAQRRNVWVRIHDDEGNYGWGEAAPNAFYAESVDTVAAVMPTYALVLAGARPDDVAAVEQQLLA